MDILVRVFRETQSHPVIVGRRRARNLGVAVVSTPSPALDRIKTKQRRRLPEPDRRQVAALAAENDPFWPPADASVRTTHRAAMRTP